MRDNESPWLDLGVCKKSQQGLRGQATGIRLFFDSCSGGLI